LLSSIPLIADGKFGKLRPKVQQAWRSAAIAVWIHHLRPGSPVDVALAADVSGRHRSTSKPRLTRNQIVDAAVKIIGQSSARRADVGAIVEKMSKMCERSKRTRSSESKNQKRFAKQYGLALRKFLAMTGKAPTDFHALPFHVSAPQLERIPVMWRRSLHVGSNWRIPAG
jgi:hypothetical protein